MASFEQIPMCCGIHELGYIRDDMKPEDSIMSFHHSHLGAHVVFSVTSNETKMHKKGYALAAFIEKHGLGTLVTTPAKPNPGHNGTIKAWLWSPNKKALKALQKELYEKNQSRYHEWGYSDEDTRRDPYGW